MAKLQDYRRSVLVDGPDYGVIPGTQKPTLLKPGAEKLLLAAGLGFTILKVDDEDARTHQGVTYRCTVRRGAQIVAECDGYAGYDESRFYTSLADAEAKEKENSVRFKKAVRQWKIVEYRAPWNSVIKMAQKRAMVGATLNALAASGIFTQDLEDTVPEDAAPAFDPMALLAPHLGLLDADSKREMSAWRRAGSHPDPRHMDLGQAGQALVQIGRLLAVQASPQPVVEEGPAAGSDHDVTPGEGITAPTRADGHPNDGRPFDADDGSDPDPRRTMTAGELQDYDNQIGYKQ
jgi:hypothetical protein